MFIEQEQYLPSCVRLRLFNQRINETDSLLENHHVRGVRHEFVKPLGIGCVIHEHHAHIERAMRVLFGDLATTLIDNRGSVWRIGKHRAYRVPLTKQSIALYIIKPCSLHDVIRRFTAERVKVDYPPPSRHGICLQSTAVYTTRKIPYVRCSSLDRGLSS